MLFNLSAIVGSAILYGDFRRATFHQIVTFLYGCAATFAGVLVTTWSHGGLDQTSGSQEDTAGDDIEAATVAGGDDNAANDVANGTLGRRNRATLVVPDISIETSPTRTTPILRHRHSIVSMIGLSPAQVSDLCLLICGSSTELDNYSDCF